MKQCPKCREVKSFETFYASSTHKTGYASWCKPCESERSKAKNIANREHRLAKAKEWQEANKDRHRASIQVWRESNKERYANYFVKYREENRGACNAKWMRREAARKQRTPVWLTNEMHKKIEVEYKLAAWCSKVMGEDYHVDHVVPLQGKTVSGLHVPWNLRVILGKENRMKSNRHIETLQAEVAALKGA